VHRISDSVSVGVPEIAGTPESLHVRLKKSGNHLKAEYILRQQGGQEKKLKSLWVKECESLCVGTKGQFALKAGILVAFRRISDIIPSELWRVHCG